MIQDLVGILSLQLLMELSPANFIVFESIKTVKTSVNCRQPSHFTLKQSHGLTPFSFSYTDRASRGIISARVWSFIVSQLDVTAVLAL